jgi:hypothetical protein
VTNSLYTDIRDTTVTTLSPAKNYNLNIGQTMANYREGKEGLEPAVFDSNQAPVDGSPTGRLTLDERYVNTPFKSATEANLSFFT